ncbi:hypothetical protein BLA60_09965 [Actinophytocola xinjiangensis]|uniref:Choice-of-anchor A domain-containing protein n=1 Tax=Actinophytocola xinjiangensis TaxID=485602 RepID=A0A7Z0WQ16_9PSEU|nr:hypothetical protein BLA60_09965 [Actinophytocola xinjiangensis]
MNPVRPVSPTDADVDPSHHFLVLVEGDGQLYRHEAEGTVLVGGDVSWDGYNVAPKSTPYTVPGEDAPAGLVVLGAIDFAGSTGGQQTLEVTQNTNGYFAGLAGATVVEGGGITYVVPPGGDQNARPAIEVERAQSAESMARDAGFDVPGLFALYRELAGEIAQCANTIELLDQNGDGPWPGAGNATIRLRPGQNVVNATAAQLASVPNLNLAAGSAPLGEATLVVNVPDQGSYDWQMPQLGFQGNANARYILWNLASAGTVTLPVTESDTVWGTVYAPDARLVDLSVGNIEGNVVVRELQHGGSVVAGGPDVDGGEIHDAPFEGTVTPCGTPPTTTTTTTTTGPTTTTEPTTTEPTTTEPTTSEPTTTEPTTTGPVTTTSTAPPPGPGLAQTGFPAGLLVVGGAGLTVVGGVLFAVARRTRRRPAR